MSTKRKGAGLDFSHLSAMDSVGAVVLPPPAAPTGIGLMGAAVAGAAALQQRVDALEAQAEQLRSERGALLLDASHVAVSRWANRHAAAFAGPDFEQFKQEIQDAGGNVQPVMVRPLPDAPAPFVYELVFGHRRHRACFDLGLPLRAVVQELSDADLFGYMDRENRRRRDLSAWEQGTMYRRALEAGLFPSAKKLALSVGMDLSQLGKALRIADLPAEVVAAFASPLDLQYRMGAPLAAALEANRDAVLRRAGELAGSGERAGKVFRALVAAGETPTAAGDGEGDGEGEGGEGGGTVPPPPTRLDIGDGRFADVHFDGGRAVLEFDASLLDAVGWGLLEVALRTCVKR